MFGIFERRKIMNVKQNVNRRLESFDEWLFKPHPYLHLGLGLWNAYCAFTWYVSMSYKSGLERVASFGIGTLSATFAYTQLKCAMQEFDALKRNQ